jgi:hypothetical protein
VPASFCIQHLRIKFSNKLFLLIFLPTVMRQEADHVHLLVQPSWPWLASHSCVPFYTISASNQLKKRLVSKSPLYQTYVQCGVCTSLEIRFASVCSDQRACALNRARIVWGTPSLTMQDVALEWFRTLSSIAGLGLAPACLGCDRHFPGHIDQCTAVARHGVKGSQSRRNDLGTNKSFKCAQGW